MRPGEESPQRSGLDLLAAGLDALAHEDVAGMSDAIVRTQLLALLSELNRMHALIATRVASFDNRDAAVADGIRTTRTWLRCFGRLSARTAGALLARARLLRLMPTVAAQATAGRIGPDQIDPMTQLASKVGAAAVAEFDPVLAELAATTGPAEVGAACARIHAHLDPDGASPDPEADFNRRELTLSRLGAMLHLRGRLDPEGAAALQTALDALQMPPRSGDERSPAQRRADALVQLARQALNSAALPDVAGERPHLGLLVDLDLLLPTTDHAAADPAATDKPTATDQAATASRSAAYLDWIGEVPLELAQRIACDSQVWRAILDPATGLPLDVGRQYRLVPHWMRRALAARDRGCRWPRCDAPAAWTDAHHLIPWYQGGTTTIDGLILLCRWHHVCVHEGHWRIHLDRTTGEVSVTRPDGEPYELNPSQPWLTATTRRHNPITPRPP